MVSVYKSGNKLYVDERIYKTKLTNGLLIKIFEEIGIQKNECIVADCAEPKSIADLENAGYWVEEAKKGGDSITAGVKILQEYDIYVTANSLNVIKEKRGYRWAKKKDGSVLDVPIKVNDHAMDAERYVALNKLSLFQSSYHFEDDDW